MSPLLILRVHTDLRLGFGHLARALVLQEQWRALGGSACIAVSGDERARQGGRGQHPSPGPAPALPDRGPGRGPARRPARGPQGRGAVVLVDHWEAAQAELAQARPLKVALMEDEGDAHEQADLLFQPFLEGVSWPASPLKVVNGRKVRPLETRHGACRVLRGSQFIVVDARGPPGPARAGSRCSPWRCTSCW